MGRKKHKPSDNIAHGVFAIMYEFKSYRLEHIFSDEFTVPQYLELVDMIVEYYKEQQKEIEKSKKGKSTLGRRR